MKEAILSSLYIAVPLLIICIIFWPFKKRQKYRRIEIKFVRYAEADTLIRQNVGKPENEQWVLAREEDDNRLIGFVYIERREKIK